MSTCSHCHQDHGKQICPALHGPICMVCCGKNRGGNISCPPDCPFFKEVLNTDSFRQALHNVTELMLSAMLSQDGWCEKAEQAYFGAKGRESQHRMLEGWEEPNLLAYMSYGFKDEKGDRFVHHFQRDYTHKLKLTEKATITALQEAWFSLFEVQEVKQEEGIILLDLLTNETFFIHEKQGTEILFKFDLLLCWVIELGGQHILTSTATRVPRQHRGAILKAMRMTLSKKRKVQPNAPLRELLLETVGPAQRALGRAFQQWRPPKLVTMDGEDIVLCKAFFDMSDTSIIQEKLTNHPDIDEAWDGFFWVDRQGRKVLGPGPLQLGSISLKDGRLVLETKSRERLERGKAFLTNFLGTLVRHRIDCLQDVEVAMAGSGDGEPMAVTEKKIPLEDQEELVKQFMSDHLRQWIDEQIPALEGKTPRQAVRTKRGREKVKALLKDQEHLAQRMPGGVHLDFSVIYRELGLEA